MTWHIGMMWGSRVIMQPAKVPEDFNPAEDDVDGELFTERLESMRAEVAEEINGIFPFYRFHLQKKMRMHVIAEASFGLIIADDRACQYPSRYGRNPLPDQGAYTLKEFFQTAFDKTKGEDLGRNEVFVLFAKATQIARKYDLMFPEPQPLIYHHLDLEKRHGS